MEDEENNEGSKKIALKIPSLFFRSKEKEEDGGVPTPTVKRPMPASTPDSFVSGGSAGVNGGSVVSGSGSESAKRRPMPASIRKKLEVQRSESPEIGGDGSQTEENGERELEPEEMETGENDEGGGVDGQEESQEEEPEPVKVQTSPKKSRPMPASARRKLEGEEEKRRKLKLEEANDSVEEGMDEDKETERSSDKAALSMDEGSESESSHGKKINISLGVGGIKFPSFKAPAPPLSSTSSTSKDVTTSQSGKITKQADDDEDMEESTRPNRSSRSRSSATTNDLVALEDSKYQCQYCDIEFYNLYSKKKHEETHFKVKEDPPKKESSASENKSKPKPKKDLICSYCNQKFWNRKKLSSHQTKCKIRCRICNINFKNQADFNSHNEQVHSGNNEDNSQQSQDTSQDLGSGSEEDIFEKVSPPPTPKSTSSKSVKSKASSENDEPSERSKNVDTFKKKIADVLCNLGNSNFKKRKREDSEKESDESDVDSPPTKKIVLSKDKGRAMPASIRKKFEEAKKSQSSAPSVKKPAKEIHDLECEVCHRVFSNNYNRLRHERDAHSLKNPRPASSSKGVGVKKEVPKKDTSKPLRLEDLPISGRCPICSKFIGTRLRRHVRNVHKIGPGEDVNSDTPKPTPIAIRGSGQKSYNIYRSAADKAKKRLVSPVKRHEEEESEDEFTPVAVPAKKKEAPTKSALPTDFKCGCCDKTFTVKVDFNEHMLRRHPKNKRLITCSLCLHQFSHEEDFILHLQFRHKELISGMIEKEGESGSKPKATVSVAPKSQPSTSGLGPASRRFLRKTEETNEAQAACKPFTVKISNRERSLAENSKKKERKRPGPAFTKRTSPSPEPEPMDTYYDEGPASPVTFEEEVEETETVGIAITSTFSQRKESNEMRMPCSTCTEVFYSFEALRKHELYFHNVKTSQMCPICGVYPQNLSKHLKEHEEKSVRCGCSLCQINFADFSILLKHNLKHHPGPDKKGINGEEEKAEDEMAAILKDTNKKLADNDWDEDGFDVVSSMLKPVQEKKKEEEVEKPKPKLRGPMPASVRARIQMSEQKKAEEKQKETKPPKTARPMPASMRAKLLAKGQAIPSPTSSVSSSSKPKARPMPASVKARIMNKAELKEVAPPPATHYSPPPPVDLCSDNEERKKNDVGKSAEVVTLSDDDDIAVIEERVKPRGTDSFNIADEIAEHNRAVQMAMGEVPKRKDNVQVHFKCKLCLRTFDTQDGIRRHIRRGHSEYGPEHTENLYEQVYQEAQVASDVPRRRRSNVNYNKSYNHDEDDIEEEVIVNRGTSTRPRGAVADPDYNQSEIEMASPAISHSVEGMDSNLLLYACKYCGKRMDSHGNVRRHIGKAHPAMRGVDENDVIMLEVGKENEFVPSNEHLVAAVVPDEVGGVQEEFGQTQMPPPVAYKCKICQKTMEKRASLMQHISRSHPEIKSGRNSTSFVQEIYENELLNSVMGGEEEKAGETYACGFCTFETSDEHEYVSHYKQHTGVSPYNCHYCSATFNKSEQLAAHISREHTGSEFLNTDEAEISMEEMVGVGEISVSSATPILIENPKMITLNRGFSEKKKGRAGPASKTRRRSGAKEQEQSNEEIAGGEVGGEVEEVVENENVEQEGVEEGGDDTQSTENNVDDNENEEEMELESESLSLPYQGDLSSLFPSLGGMALGTMADIDGGMDLD